MAETTAPGFKGLRVVSFESRRSDQMADLIRRNGGEAIVAPSMREVPLEENKEAIAFGERLLRGEFDVVVFLTGVGARTLFDVLKSRYPFEKIQKALSETMLVTRGPKPVAALAEAGLSPQIRGPEPNTWKELLAELDKAGPVKGKTVTFAIGLTLQRPLDQTVGTEQRKAFQLCARQTAALHALVEALN